MRIFRKITNLIKTIATGGRESSEIIQDGSQALKIVKEKIFRFLARFVKKAALYMLIIGLFLMIAILCVSVVFRVFSMDFYGDEQAMTEFKPEDIKVWADSLSDEDIEEMKGQGVNIHPKKIYQYALIEDESYPKNLEILIPTHVKKWGDGGSSDYTTYSNYNYKRGDASYPYRQWWQSTSVLDVINSSADKKNNLKIIKGAKKELKPSFDWADPQTDNYTEGMEYEETSDKEEEYIVLTEVEIVTSGGGSTTSSTDFTEERTYKPLPFLNMATIMFGDVNFDYKEINERPEPVVNVSESTYTVTSTVTSTDADGNVEEYEETETYTETITTTVTREVNTWELIGVYNDYQDTFINFLKDYKIDTSNDPYLMYMMAEHMPQSYDFLYDYGNYLSYMGLYLDSYSYEGQSGTYTGDFGEFEGGTFAWPVPSHHHITSYYGYRKHPVTGVLRNFHTGIDLRAPLGVDIISTADGIVSFVGSKGGYGKTVIVNHGSGIESLYAHNSKISVSPGQNISQGEIVAKAGSTGRSTASHLHFEIRKNGKPVEPLAWLNR